MILMEGNGTFRCINRLLIIERLMNIFNDFFFTGAGSSNMLLRGQFNRTPQGPLTGFYKVGGCFYVHLRVIIFNFYHRLL